MMTRSRINAITLSLLLFFISVIPTSADEALQPIPFRIGVPSSTLHARQVQNNIDLAKRELENVFRSFKVSAEPAPSLGLGHNSATNLLVSHVQADRLGAIKDPVSTSKNPTVKVRQILEGRQGSVCRDDGYLPCTNDPGYCCKAGKTCCPSTDYCYIAGSDTCCSSGGNCGEGQDCCEDADGGCVPSGAVCCAGRDKYCPQGHRCCPGGGCALPGETCSSCGGIQCTSDEKCCGQTCVPKTATCCGTYHCGSGKTCCPNGGESGCCPIGSNVCCKDNGCCKEGRTCKEPTPEDESTSHS